MGAFRDDERQDEHVSAMETPIGSFALSLAGVRSGCEDTRVYGVRVTFAAFGATLDGRPPAHEEDEQDHR